jgi:hypothetical protein
LYKFLAEMLEKAQHKSASGQRKRKGEIATKHSQHDKDLKERTVSMYIYVATIRLTSQAALHS